MHRYFTPAAFATNNYLKDVCVVCRLLCHHVYPLFLSVPETSSKPLEEVVAIFEDSGPGSIKYIGTPAWKIRNDRRTALQLERNVVDPRNKSADIRSSYEASSKDESRASVQSIYAHGLYLAVDEGREIVQGAKVGQV